MVLTPGMKAAELDAGGVVHPRQRLSVISCQAHTGRQ